MLSSELMTRKSSDADQSTRKMFDVPPKEKKTKVSVVNEGAEDKSVCSL
jgi:hypothetical protein